MYKSCLALGVTASLFACSPAFSATVFHSDDFAFDIFGKVQSTVGNDAALNDISESSDYDETGMYTMASLGIASRVTLNSAIDGVMMALWETKHDGELAKARYMFSGLDAKSYGTLLFGQGDSAFYTVIGATDIFSVLDSDTAEYYTLGEQRNRLIMYTLSALSWDLRLSYQWAEEDMGNTPLDLNYGLSAAVSTKFGKDITLAYGVDYSNFSYDEHAHDSYVYLAPMVAADKDCSLQEAVESQYSHRLRSRSDYAFSLSYGIFKQPGLYASLVAGATRYKGLLDHHIYYAEGVLSYTLSNGLGASVHYGHKKYENLTPISEIGLGLYYDINASFKLFAEAQFDLGGEADVFYGQKTLNKDKFALGLELAF